MTFPFTVYGAAFAGALLLSLAAVPVWRRWAYRTGFVDDPGHRKIHGTPVALAGGLAVATALYLPLAAAGIWLISNGPGLLDLLTRSLVEYGLQRRAGELGVFCAGGLGMLALGWLDDRHELGPGTKLAGQIVVGVATAASGIRVTLFVESELFSVLVTVLWILTITNAFNFIDNMNGLCAGLGAIAAWTFAWSAAIHGQYLVALLAFLVCGGLAGFVPYNFPRATIFLGDAGSHLVGYCLAVLAILPDFYSREQPQAIAVLNPLLILAVPLVDLVQVVWIRWRAGKPVYVGDNNHLSHRLTRAGFNRTTAVLILWGAGAVAGAASFLVYAPG